MYRAGETSDCVRVSKKEKETGRRNQLNVADVETIFLCRHSNISGKCELKRPKMRHIVVQNLSDGFRTGINP